MLAVDVARMQPFEDLLGYGIVVSHSYSVMRHVAPGSSYRIAIQHGNLQSRLVFRLGRSSLLDGCPMATCVTLRLAGSNLQRRPKCQPGHILAS
jgi:hypothetical protein